jgi:3-methyladenine DNA glycosylase AlkD
MKAEIISSELQKLGDPDIARHSKRFFKTGAGEYGDGDSFLGIRVPVLRKESIRFLGTPIDEVEKLLHSEFHEVRLCALLLLVKKFEMGDATEKKHIFDVYLANTRCINNWDLVDSSAYQIVGAYLEKREKDVLYGFADSVDLWQRRIAILATFYFIKRGDFSDALRISEKLLNDNEDLIHKAVGWMLREIGKRDLFVLEQYLKIHYRKMPRTMLRYAIEKFPEDLRQLYLKSKI